MDLNKLKSEHPALFAQVFGLGKTEGRTEGIAAEKVRVQAWSVFNDIDPEKVKLGIEGSEVPNAKDISEFQLKVALGNQVKAITDESAGVTDTSTEAKTKEQLEAEADAKILDADLGEIKPY